MNHGCPQCREPIAWAQLCRALAWGSHARPCRGCAARVMVRTPVYAVIGVTVVLLAVFVGLSSYPGWMSLPAAAFALAVAAGCLLLALRITIIDKDRRNCAACGYDLRGAPAAGGSATCPECGYIISTFHGEHPGSAR